MKKGRPEGRPSPQTLAADEPPKPVPGDNTQADLHTVHRTARSAGLEDQGSVHPQLLLISCAGSLTAPATHIWPVAGILGVRLTAGVT